MVDPNTRQGKRTPVTLKIKFKSETIEQFIERYAVDVSQGGIFIRTKEPLAVGTQMRFEFQLRDASPLIAGEGTVVWTRENDPSRPAIAPGMGVRFDRLAEGSQSVLERILSEKAKQAPSRTVTEAPTKPPLFTDTPTRVAPIPVQEQLLGRDGDRSGRMRQSDAYHDSHTPLPKPMPFHSDADEFDEQAFEEATKVRALDELIAQTADGGILLPSDELAARRGAVRADSTLADAPAAAAAAAAMKAPVVDRDSAPGLPSPPEAPPLQTPRSVPRMLDSTPSPRTEPSELNRTKLGVEPARSMHPSVPPMGHGQGSIKDAPTRPSGMRAVAAEPTSPVRAQKGSKTPVVLLSVLVLVAAGAAVWFFVLRDRLAAEQVAENTTAPGPGSEKVTVTNPTPGSGSEIEMNPDVGSGSAQDTPPPVPAADLVATTVTSSTDKATIEIVGADGKVIQSGPAPLVAKLEKDKVYKARVTAAGHAISEVEVKGGGPKQNVKLAPKPRMIDVNSNPPGALIYIDGTATGQSTPRTVQLTNSQSRRKSVRVTIKKSGFSKIDRTIGVDAYTEDATQMIAKLDEKLTVQAVQVSRPPPPDRGSASTGSAPPPTGSDTPPSGSATPTGSATPPPTGSATPTPPTGTGTGSAPAGTGTGSAPAGTGSAAKPPTPTGGSAGSASAQKPGEPEPDFVKLK